jgi:hypothetical protein
VKLIASHPRPPPNPGGRNRHGKVKQDVGALAQMLPYDAVIDAWLMC